MDELFGSQQRRKPGESWKPSVEKAVQNAAHYGTIIKPEDFEGSVQFIGIEEINGRQRMKITGETRLKRFELKQDDREGKPRLPEGMKLTGGTRESSFTGFYGVDPADTSFSGTSASIETYSIEGKTEDGTEFKSDAKTTHTIAVEATSR